MKEKKVMRAISLLLVFALVGAMFVPAVSALSANNAYSKMQIEKKSISDEKREYIVYSDEFKTEEVFLVIETKKKIDEKEVWQAEVFKISPDGKVSKDSSFGKDSYYWSDNDGVHMHIGPIDMSYILAGGSTAAGSFGIWLGIALGLTGPAGVALGLALAALIIISGYLYTNPDNSLDMFISYTSIALMPVFIVLPGPQPVPITLGTSIVILGL